MEEDCGHSYSDREFEEMQKQRDEFERDAKRYQWLKANHLQTGPDSWIRTGDDLEEAIDAAMMDTGTEPRPSSVE